MTDNADHTPLASTSGGDETEANAADDTVEKVGDADARADAARSGADTDALDRVDLGISDDQLESTDTDGEPVGAADAAADAERSGADTDRMDTGIL